MTRRESLTQKVKTPFASVFLAMEYVDGRPVSLKIDHAQRLDQSTVGLLLEAIATAATEMMEGR